MSVAENTLREAMKLLYGSDKPADYYNGVANRLYYACRQALVERALNLTAELHCPGETIVMKYLRDVDHAFQEQGSTDKEFLRKNYSIASWRIFGEEQKRIPDLLGHSELIWFAQSKYINIDDDHLFVLLNLKSKRNIADYHPDRLLDMHEFTCVSPCGTQKSPYVNPKNGTVSARTLTYRGNCRNLADAADEFLEWCMQ
jgi:hypothetical protein